MDFLYQNWFDITQTVFIVLSFLITAFALRNDIRAWKVEHLININDSYKAIWEKTYAMPELSRIRKSNLDLKTNPITEKERRLAREIIMHIYIVYEATKLKQVHFEMEKDIYDFLHLPIPSVIWNEVKKYQNKDFVRFIDKLLSKSRLETIELI